MSHAMRHYGCPQERSTAAATHRPNIRRINILTHVRGMRTLTWRATEDERTQGARCLSRRPWAAFGSGWVQALSGCHQHGAEAEISMMTRPVLDLPRRLRSNHYDSKFVFQREGAEFC